MTDVNHTPKKIEDRLVYMARKLAPYLFKEKLASSWNILLDEIDSAYETIDRKDKLLVELRAEMKNYWAGFEMECDARKDVVALLTRIDAEIGGAK